MHGERLPDPAGAGRRMRLICDSYRLADRGRLLETILWWQDRTGRSLPLMSVKKLGSC